MSSLNFRILLTTIFADRMAYYGLRSVVILYAIFQFNVPDETALYYYGFLSLALCIAQILGGLIGDLVSGARNGMLIGFGLCILGSALVWINEPVFLVIGAFMVVAGSGFARPNSFSYIGKFTSHDKELLEKRFIVMYGTINLGAFVSSLVIGLIGEEFGYLYSFMIILALFVISFALIFVIGQFKSSSIEDLNAKNSARHPISRNLIFIILIAVSSTVFWIIFEKYSSEIVTNKFHFARDFFSMTSIGTVLMSVSVILCLILMIPYYFVAKHFSLYSKVAIALILIGVCWGSAVLIFNTGALEFGLISLLLLTLSEAIADVLITPTTLTLLAQHSSKKFYGLIFAGYSTMIYLGLRIFYWIESYSFSYLFDILIVLVLSACIVMFFVLPSTLKPVTKSQADQL